MKAQDYLDAINIADVSYHVTYRLLRWSGLVTSGACANDGIMPVIIRAYRTSRIMCT